VSPRSAIEWQLPAGGPRIVLAELAPTEVLTAMRSAGRVGPAEVRLECVRHSLREVDGRKVAYLDVAGGRLAQLLPRTRHQAAALRCWAQQHEPTADEIDAVRASARVEIGADGERWTVTLPGDREATLAERDLATVGRAMDRARAGTRAESVAQLQTLLEGLRDSVVELDGRAADLSGRGIDALSVRECLLLGVAWEELHAAGAEEASVVGERKPAGGTP